MNKSVFAPMSKYLTLTRAGILEGLSFRGSYFVAFIGNLVYLVVIYFLWRAIYNSSPTEVVNGMTFTDTMVYLVLASALFNFMEAYIVWDIGRNIQSGRIIMDIIKPIRFQSYMFFYYSGGYVIAFFTTFLPTFLVVYFITGGAISLGTNLLFFAISVLMGIVINFSIDFFVSAICLYTMSIYGINIMKEVVVLLLSGATIPLAFFPEPLKTVVGYLPFQAIYNTPLQILINQSLSFGDIAKMLCVQLFWMILTFTACNLFWRKSLKIITVNGG
jgi:ABC-2 type transport system permease protein